MPRHRAAPPALLTVLVLVLALGACAASASEIPPQAGVAQSAPGVEVGIADQKADLFSDPRFGTLGITRARLAIGWDAMTKQRDVAEIDAWLQGAKAAGVEPLVSFMHSRSERRAVPSPERLKYEFRRFRQMWPWVTTFATWNEANHCGEPLCHRPKLAAAYYRALRKECPSCTILAPEVLDTPNMRGWVRDFTRKLGHSPKIWGLHNYVEANRFRMQRLRELLRAAPRSQIWLTETGGLVRRDNGSETEIPEGPRHAGEVTRFIFDRILPRNPRVTRVYLYHWNSASAQDTWDSALITPGGRERSSLFVLARVLRFGLRPNASFRSTMP